MLSRSSWKTPSLSGTKGYFHGTPSRRRAEMRGYAGWGGLPKAAAFLAASGEQGHAPVADQRIQNGDGAFGLEGVDEVGCAPAVVRQRVRRGVAEFLRDAADGFRRNAGDLRRPFGRVLPDACGKFIKADGVLADKFLVVAVPR